MAGASALPNVLSPSACAGGGDTFSLVDPAAAASAVEVRASATPASVFAADALPPDPGGPGGEGGVTDVEDVREGGPRNGSVGGNTTLMNFDLGVPVKLARRSTGWRVLRGFA